MSIILVKDTIMEEDGTEDVGQRKTGRNRTASPGNGEEGAFIITYETNILNHEINVNIINNKNRLN